MFKHKHNNLSHISYNKTCATCKYKLNCTIKDEYMEFQNKLMDINQEYVGKYPFIAYPSCYYKEEKDSFKLTNLSL